MIHKLKQAIKTVIAIGTSEVSTEKILKKRRKKCAAERLFNVQCFRYGNILQSLAKEKQNRQKVETF